MDENEKVLNELNQAVLQYAALGKRTAAQVVKEKGLQFILGSHSHGANFKGAYESFLEKKPTALKIRMTVSGLFADSLGLRISPRSYKKADRILGGNPAGLFVRSAKNGKPLLVRQTKRGKRTLGKKGDAFLSTHKNLIPFRREGEIILNRQSLAAYFEIQKRIGARGYTAASFLLKRYKTTIERLANGTYKNGQLKGVSSVDAVVMHKHFKALVPNKVGGAIGGVECEFSGRECWFKASSYVSTTSKRAFNQITARVMRNITSDIEAYITRKLAKNKK